MRLIIHLRRMSITPLYFRSIINRYKLYNLCILTLYDMKNTGDPTYID